MEYILFLLYILPIVIEYFSFRRMYIKSDITSNSIILDIILIFLPIVNLFLSLIVIGTYLMNLDFFSNINKKLLKIFYFQELLFKISFFSVRSAANGLDRLHPGVESAVDSGPALLRHRDGVQGHRLRH